jgi:hypothetical protein
MSYIEVIYIQGWVYHQMNHVSKHDKKYCTVGVWVPDKSSFQMFTFGISQGIWKSDRLKTEHK